jgi:hydroxymethylbilane synthase
VLAERAFARALGGTCHSPVGAHARVEGEEIIFACELLSEDGRDRLAETGRFAVGDLQGPAALARAMLADAPPSIRRLFGAG